MEYAIQLLLPILGGLMLGNWLHTQYGFSQMWSLGLAILGMIAGLAIMYKRIAYPELYGGQKPKRFTSKPKAGKDPEAGKHIKDLDFLYKEHDPKDGDWPEERDKELDQDD